MDREPFASFKEARADVRQAEGLEKVSVWIKNRILEPRFDDPDAQMPKLGITEKEAIIITEFLARSVTEENTADQPFYGIKAKIRGTLPDTIRARDLAVALVVGSLMGAVSVALSIALISIIRKARTKGGR